MCTVFALLVLDYYYVWNLAGKIVLWYWAKTEFDDTLSFWVEEDWHFHLCKLSNYSIKCYFWDFGSSPPNIHALIFNTFEDSRLSPIVICAELHHRLRYSVLRVLKQPWNSANPVSASIFLSSPRARIIKLWNPILFLLTDATSTVINASPRNNVQAQQKENCMIRMTWSFLKN